jgi:glycine cleavage system H lipoate-binding protein
MRIGLEPKLALLLPPVKAVVIPGVGQVVTPEAYCFWVVAEGGVLPFHSPVPGVLAAINPRIADEPQLLQLSPASEGWILECLSSDLLPSSQELMQREQAEREYRQELEHFKETLFREAQRTGGATVRTLADGGEVVGVAGAILGAARYFDILKKAMLPDG